MHGTSDLKQTQLLLCVLISTIYEPLSAMVHSCHSYVTWVVSLQVPFTLTLCSGSSPSLPTDSRLARAWDYLREIFKCAHLKFMIYGRKQAYTHTHTHMRNAVPPLWGSLRLTPIISYLGFIYIFQYCWSGKTIHCCLCAFIDVILWRGCEPVWLAPYPVWFVCWHFSLKKFMLLLIHKVATYDN